MNQAVEQSEDEEPARPGDAEAGDFPRDRLGGRGQQARRPQPQIIAQQHEGQHRGAEQESRDEPRRLRPLPSEPAALDRQDPEHGKRELEQFIDRVDRLLQRGRLAGHGDEVEPRGQAREHRRRQECRGVGSDGGRGMGWGHCVAACARCIRECLAGVGVPALAG